MGAAFGGTQAQVLSVVHGFVEQGGDVTDAPMDVKQLIEPWVQLWCW